MDPFPGRTLLPAQPSGKAPVHAGTLMKTRPPAACKMSAGGNRKSSQLHRKNLLSDSSPRLPDFLSGWDPSNPPG
ncbi:unnamed protein product [Gadus morhua 'NCC']